MHLVVTQNKPPMVLKPSNIAFHEAAHVVLSIYYDFKIHGVSIKPDGESKGRAMTDEELRSTDWDKCKAYCRMTLAGGIAEEIYADEASPGDGTDMQTVNRVVDLKHSADSLKAKLKRSKAGQRITLNQSEMAEIKEIRKVKEQLRNETRSLLKREEVAESITYVAEMIEKKKEITEDEFTRLKEDVQQLLVNDA